MKNILLLFLVFLGVQIHAQDTTYARKILKKLGSTEFSGRGYINGGIDSAANFLAKEFERIGLMPVEDSYVQKLKVEVNNINEASLNLNGINLEPGTEFILDIHCKDLSGEFKCILLNERFRQNTNKVSKLKKKAAGKVVILAKYEATDEQAKKWYDYIAYANPYDAAGAIILDSSGFVFSAAKYSDLQNYFIARLHPSAFPQKKVKTCSVNINSTYIPKYPVNNVIGYLQGREYPDSFIVITAHYDHVGMMDKAIFPGANDNASGIAMMLDLAKKIKGMRYRPRYSLVFMAFASEEIGLKGSTYFVDNPLFDLNKIRFLINLDMVGTGSDGITVVNAGKFEDEYNLMVELNENGEYLKQVKKRGESCNSDHCPFYQKGVPSVFIYTMGDEYLEYHTVGDKPELVPFTEYEGLFKLLEEFIYSL
ncbi:MAG: hypothetical protein C0592_01765 [Marinilabiliales bacterium]|nr:MAG: hypothetical protein C0592_01765 [Marinilabiliales bacterium]